MSISENQIEFSFMIDAIWKKKYMYKFIKKLKIITKIKYSIK